MFASRGRLVTAIVFAGLASPAFAQAPAAVPALMDFGSDQVVGCVVVPDLAATLGRAEAVAEAFAPGQVAPGSLKGMVGQAFGDPELANLDGARPIVVIALKPEKPNGPPQAALFLPLKDSAAYEPALQQAMGLQTKALDGLLVAAPTPKALEAAAGLRDAYGKISGAGFKGDLRLAIHAGRALDEWGALLKAQADGLIQMMAGMAAMAQPAGGADPAGMAKILKLELKALLAVLFQLDGLQADLRFDAKALDFEIVTAAKPGSALADACRAPTAANRARGLLASGGVMTAAYAFEPAGVQAFVERLAADLAKDADAAEFLGADAMAMLKEWCAAADGTCAAAFRADAKSGFAMDMVLGVTDGGKAFSALEKGIALLGPGGAWNGLYTGMGLEMKAAVEKNARTRGGVAVHRVKMAIEAGEDANEFQAAQAAQMKAFARDMEVAIVGGFYLASNDPAALDALIDRAAAGKEGSRAALQSETAFGGGRHMYFDYDFGGVMKAMVPLMPKPQRKLMGAMFGKLPEGRPMLGAVTLGGGRSLTQMRMPLEPFVQMMKASQAAALGAMDADPGEENEAEEEEMEEEK